MKPVLNDVVVFGREELALSPESYDTNLVQGISTPLVDDLLMDDTGFLYEKDLSLLSDYLPAEWPPCAYVHDISLTTLPLNIKTWRIRATATYGTRTLNVNETVNAGRFRTIENITDTTSGGENTDTDEIKWYSGILEEAVTAGKLQEGQRFPLPFRFDYLERWEYPDPESEDPSPPTLTSEADLTVRGPFYRLFSDTSGSFRSRPVWLPYWTVILTLDDEDNFDSKTLRCDLQGELDHAPVSRLNGLGMPLLARGDLEGAATYSVSIEAAEQYGPNDWQQT